MRMFSNGRDKNWLRPVAAFLPSGFFISKTDVVTETIVRELPELFEGTKETAADHASLVFQQIEDAGLGDEGYVIARKENTYYIEGNTTRALLYGMYGLHRLAGSGQDITQMIRSIPDQSLRIINHWDNFDGSIERGYAGDSIFFAAGSFRNDFDLIGQYAHLLASTGINALSVNNVNVRGEAVSFITTKRLMELKPIYQILKAYGIRMFISVNFAAPMLIGALTTADPCAPEVIAWWQEAAARTYQILPELGGFLVKADSEGEPGPFAYGCDHDEGANLFARVIKPFGGTVIWRCFVYNCQQDWRDRSIDRARAQYDHFIGLDGRFDDNVILQIKNGPIDFQVREPVSPLFGALRKTNQILEYQITQEYTGQQKHIFYLLPMWKEVLNHDTKHGTVADCVGETIHRHSPVPACSGIAAVGNAGMDSNWTGHKLAQANLYGFGRMAWDNYLDSEAILDEWISLTFDLSAAGKKTLTQMMMTSARTYEDYTAPHGIGFMVAPGHHYGPAVDGYEYDRWGTYHYADRQGIGVDRTAATGTGYTRQYADAWFEEYEDINTCPDELLLFFHHVPYTFVLQSGKTLIQSIYDTHFTGVLQVGQYISDWETLKPELDPDSYENVRSRLEEQYRCAKEWRDQINTYFYRKSGIADEKGRIIY